MRQILSLLCVTVATRAFVFGQNTAVLWGTFDQGFAIPTSSRTMVKSAAGQAFIGFTQSADTWHNAGFLADTLQRGSRGPSGPMVSFRRTYGGGSFDDGYSLVQTSDKGFIVAGSSYSFQPLSEAYLIKVSENGAVQWQRAFHYGVQQAALKSVIRTSEGGYAAAGQILGNGTLFTASYIAKVNANGDTLWTRMYDGSTSSNLSDVGNAIQQTSDGGYILVGSGSQKISIIKTNAAGDTLWTKHLILLAGLANSAATCVQLTSDGGYIVVGWAQAPFIRNIQLIKLDSSGATQWVKSFGGLNEFSFSGTVRQTIDGGYVISGDYAPQGGGTQAYLIKTDQNGDSSWTRKYFSPGNNHAPALTQTFDGGYIVAGVTGQNQNVQDAFLLKTNANGDSVWAKIFGGGGQDVGRSVVQSDDGGYAFAGWTSSSGAGNLDMWLVKGDENGNVTSVGDPIPSGIPASFTLCQNYPNPFNPSTTITYNLKNAVHVRLSIFNLLGQEVTTLVDEVQSAGHYKRVFDAGNVATGVYFYQLKAGDFVDVKKMLLLK